MGCEGALGGLCVFSVSCRCPNSRPLCREQLLDSVSDTSLQPTVHMQVSMASCHHLLQRLCSLCCCSPRM